MDIDRYKSMIAERRLIVIMTMAHVTSGVVDVDYRYVIMSRCWILMSHAAPEAHALGSLGTFMQDQI